MPATPDRPPLQRTGLPAVPLPLREVRVGDEERDRVVAALGEHYAQGRLTHVELEHRTEAAMLARTNRDLAPLLADLPALAKPPAGPGLGRVVAEWALAIALLGVAGVLALIGLLTFIVGDVGATVRLLIVTALFAAPGIAAGWFAVRDNRRRKA